MRAWPKATSPATDVSDLIVAWRTGEVDEGRFGQRHSLIHPRFLRKFSFSKDSGQVFVGIDSKGLSKDLEVSPGGNSRACASVSKQTTENGRVIRDARGRKGKSGRVST
jgi:hypothetical protein